MKLKTLNESHCKLCFENKQNVVKYKHNEVSFQKQFQNS